MGTVARKRTRPNSNPGTLRNTPNKRRAPPPEEDSDIDSELESISPNASDVEENPTTSEDSIPPNETAEEKRLRLARAYLRHVGVSEDAGEPSGEEDGHEGVDRGNEFLRGEAMRDSGRATKYLADAIGKGLNKSVVRNVCRGHSLPPTCVGLGSDGTVAVSGGKDSAVIVWDVETGKKKNVFRQKGVGKNHRRNPAIALGHIGNVLTVAVADDGGVAASGGEDGLVRIWDLKAGKQVHVLKGHRGAIQGLAFRSDSRQLFSASRDRTVKIWDVNEMAYVETLFGHGAEVNCIDSLARERALSCGKDGTLRLYKVVEGSQLVYRRALTVSIDVVSMLSEQRYVSGGDDGALCLWQSVKKKPIAVMERAHGDGLGCSSWISAVAGFRNTDLVVSGAGDGNIKFWKCEDVPKFVHVGELNVGLGFVNSIGLAKRPGVIAVAVGKEHRLGRWERIAGAKNSIQFVKLPEPDE